MLNTEKIKRIQDLINEARSFRFCGPSDDPDEQTSVILGYRHILIQLQRIASPLLPEEEQKRLNEIEIDVQDLFSVYEASAELESLLYDIEYVLVNTSPQFPQFTAPVYIIDIELISKLSSAPSSKYDVSFLVSLCKEVNSSYAHGNIIATVLTMRAVLNYIPPLFGYNTFEQVISHSGRSLKSSFAHLQNGLRKIADYYTHRTISEKDVYPTASQIEPFKPQFNLLLSEVLSKLYL